MYRLAKRGVIRLADNALLTRATDPAGWQAYLGWLAASTEDDPHVPEPLPVAPPAELGADEIVARLVAAVQAHMDQEARRRGYDNIKSASLRASLPQSPWHAEGLAYGHWMDACWAAAYQVQADVANGLRAIPSAAELIAELPTLELPA